MVGDDEGSVVMIGGHAYRKRKRVSVLEVDKQRILTHDTPTRTPSCLLAVPNTTVTINAFILIADDVLRTLRSAVARVELAQPW